MQLVFLLHFELTIEFEIIFFCLINKPLKVKPCL
jgi:hypothetical protein